VGYHVALESFILDFYLGVIMLGISRWTSVAILVCATALFGTAAFAQQRTWRDTQRFSWAPVPLDNSWTGAFAGVQLGGSWSGVTTSEFLAGTDIRTNRFDDNGSGFGGGVNFGWNWQPFARSTVVGVVFDINGLNDKVQHDFTGGNYIGTVMNFTASAQARGGVLVTPNFLLYGQGGISIANQQLKIDFGGAETNESQIVPGFTLGFGGEWKIPTNPLPFGRSMSLFADYSHTWWDTARLDRPVASPFFDYTWRRETDALKFGARISWGNGSLR
jgi:opacity protein-like surface antigen